MDLGITGRVALVTAASRGLGWAVARRLSLEGARVALCSRDMQHAETSADKIADETCNEVFGYRADVTDTNDIHSLVDTVGKELGPIDILVCNAGGPPAGIADDFTSADYRKAIELNLMSTIELCNAIYPGMRERGWGRIVCITSLSVKQPLDNLILSNTARAGVTGFAKSLSNLLAPHGVTVNCVCPGYTRTERIEELALHFAASGRGLAKDYYASIAKTIPIGRLGDPHEFAQAVVFLCSECAAYITGVSLPVDGGAVKGLLG